MKKIKVEKRKILYFLALIALLVGATPNLASSAGGYSLPPSKSAFSISPCGIAQQPYPSPAPGQTTCWPVAVNTYTTSPQVTLSSGQINNFGFLPSAYNNNQFPISAQLFITPNGTPGSGGQASDTVSASNPANGFTGLASYPSIDGTRGDGSMVWQQIGFPYPVLSPSNYSTSAYNYAYGQPGYESMSGSGAAPTSYVPWNFLSGSGYASTAMSSQTSRYNGSLGSFCDGSASYFVSNTYDQPYLSQDLPQGANLIQSIANNTYPWYSVLGGYFGAGSFNGNAPATWCLDAGRPVSSQAGQGPWNFNYNTNMMGMTSSSDVLKAGVFGAEQYYPQYGLLFSSCYWEGDCDLTQGSSDNPASLTMYSTGYWNAAWLNPGIYPSGINISIGGQNFSCQGGNSYSCPDSIPLSDLNFGGGANNVYASYSGGGSVTLTLAVTYASPPPALSYNGQTSVTIPNGNSPGLSLSSSNFSLGYNPPYPYSITVNSQNSGASWDCTSSCYITGGIGPNTYTVTLAPIGYGANYTSNSMTIDFQNPPQANIPPTPVSITPSQTDVVGVPSNGITLIGSAVPDGDTVFIEQGTTTPSSGPNGNTVCSWTAGSPLSNSSNCQVQATAGSTNTWNVQLSYVDNSPSGPNTQQFSAWDWSPSYQGGQLASENTTNNTMSVTWVEPTLRLSASTATPKVNQSSTLTATLTEPPNVANWSNWPANGATLTFYQGPASNPSLASCTPSTSNGVAINKTLPSSTSYTCVVTSAIPQTLSFFVEISLLPSNTYNPIVSNQLEITWDTVTAKPS